MSDKTPFTTRCKILAELWLDYRQDEEFQDFFEYADLGLPLAYATHEGIVEKTSISENFINEAFDLLLAGLSKEDTGFETVEDVLDIPDGV